MPAAGVVGLPTRASITACAGRLKALCSTMWPSRAWASWGAVCASIGYPTCMPRVYTPARPALRRAPAGGADRNCPATGHRHEALGSNRRVPTPCQASTSLHASARSTRAPDSGALSAALAAFIARRRLLVHVQQQRRIRRKCPPSPLCVSEPGGRCAAVLCGFLASRSCERRRSRTVFGCVVSPLGTARHGLRVLPTRICGCPAALGHHPCRA
jgi:hypothetical protein